jgi:hypothetical protein
MTGLAGEAGRRLSRELSKMAGSRLPPAILVVLLSAVGSPGLVHAGRPAAGRASFEDLLREMSAGPGNSCDWRGADFSRLEDDLFNQADEAVLHGLNGTASPASPSTSRPKDRAVRALTALEHASAEIDKDWPEENRFHSDVLDVPPALVVKMTYRNRAPFTFLGVPRVADDRKPNAAWRAVRAEDDGRFDRDRGYEGVSLFPLRRGPSNRARFLAKFDSAGCGSGVGVSYYAYEWDPEELGALDEFIKAQGAVSREEPRENGGANSLAPIGRFQAAGAIITLPYCWYSQIDTWDNPSLCAVDSYDVSGDRARFVHRAFNRPDLVPVARAIEYGQAHDYPALLAYCASREVALKILRDIPPFVYGSGLVVRPIGAAKRRVELANFDVVRFDVEKRAGRWLVYGFRIQ